MCRPSLSQAQRSVHLYLIRTGIKGVYYHIKPKSLFIRNLYIHVNYKNILGQKIQYFIVFYHYNVCANACRLKDYLWCVSLPFTLGHSLFFPIVCTKQAGPSRDPSCLGFQPLSRSVLVIDSLYCIWFNMASVDTKLGPYLWIAHALPTELLPHTKINYFNILKSSFRKSTKSLSYENSGTAFSRKWGDGRPCTVKCHTHTPVLCNSRVCSLLVVHTS